MKTYEEALQRAKAYYDSTDDVYDRKLLELVFPELKEITDDKIQKALIDIFSSCVKKDWRDIPTEKIIAWLEKQGEKSTEQSTSISDKEIAHRIAWENTKHYDQNCCKEEWCEMAAIDMAEHKNKQKPAEWSNEDKAILDGIIDAAEHHCMLTAYDIEWLKSLKLNKC